MNNLPSVGPVAQFLYSGLGVGLAFAVGLGSAKPIRYQDSLVSLASKPKKNVAPSGSDLLLPHGMEDAIANSHHPLDVEKRSDLGSGVSMAQLECAEKLAVDISDCNEHGVYVDRTEQVSRVLLNLVKDQNEEVSDWGDVMPSMLSSLVSVNLANQDIESLKKEDFHGLESITGGIYLHNNQIETLPQGIFDSIESMSELSLYGNPLVLTAQNLIDIRGIAEAPDILYHHTDDTDSVRVNLAGYEVDIFEDFDRFFIMVDAGQSETVSDILALRFTLSSFPDEPAAAYLRRQQSFDAFLHLAQTVEKQEAQLSTLPMDIRAERDALFKAFHSSILFYLNQLPTPEDVERLRSEFQAADRDIVAQFRADILALNSTVSTQLEGILTQLQLIEQESIARDDALDTHIQEETDARRESIENQRTYFTGQLELLRNQTKSRDDSLEEYVGLVDSRLHQQIQDNLDRLKGLEWRVGNLTDSLQIERMARLLLQNQTDLLTLRVEALEAAQDDDFSKGSDYKEVIFAALGLSISSQITGLVCLALSIGLLVVLSRVCKNSKTDSGLVEHESVPISVKINPVFGYEEGDPQAHFSAADKDFGSLMTLSDSGKPIFTRQRTLLSFPFLHLPNPRKKLWRHIKNPEANGMALIEGSESFRSDELELDSSEVVQSSLIREVEPDDVDLPRRTEFVDVTIESGAESVPSEVQNTEVRPDVSVEERASVSFSGGNDVSTSEALTEPLLNGEVETVFPRKKEAFIRRLSKASGGLDVSDIRPILKPSDRREIQSKKKSNKPKVLLKSIKSPSQDLIAYGSNYDSSDIL